MMEQPLGSGMGQIPAGYGLPAVFTAPEYLIEPAEIEKKVTREKRRTERLRRRQEADYSRYRLEWADDRWAQAEPPLGQSTYISNEPWTFATRVMAILGSAKMLIRVPFGSNVKERREFGQAKERFLIGVLNEADKRLSRLNQPALQDALSFQIPIRGWFAGRALLLKAVDGSTRVDISPFDPMHTYHGMGDDGLSWVCHVTRRSREDIEQAFGVDMPVSASSSQVEDNASLVDVFDYYDGQINCAVADGKWVKEPVPHYAGRVPCFLGAVGPTPFVTRYEGAGTGLDVEAHGESVYAGLRMVYDALNKTLSDRMTLVRRSLRPTTIYESPGGTKVIDGEPLAEGAGLSLATGEKFSVVELQSMAKDTELLQAEISGQMQRASLPYTVYGQSDFALSGYAINTLSQGLELVIRDRVKALETAYEQIADIVCGQYQSGAYRPLMAQGVQGKGRFKEPIDPAMVAEADDVEVTFTPSLPKDQKGILEQAQLARAGETPLFSDRTIMDDIVKVQDVDAEEDLKLEQLAATLSPIVRLRKMIEVEVKRGDMQAAEDYFIDLQGLLMQREMMLMTGGMPPGPGGPGGQPSAPGGGPQGVPGMRPPPGPGGPRGGEPTPGPGVRSGQSARPRPTGQQPGKTGG